MVAFLLLLWVSLAGALLARRLDEGSTRLAETLALGPGRVSVKAKSPEHLGLLGREEGIAAMAVVSLEVA